MKSRIVNNLLFNLSNSTPTDNNIIYLNKDEIINFLIKTLEIKNFNELKLSFLALKEKIIDLKLMNYEIEKLNDRDKIIQVKKSVFLDEIDQILGSLTIERCKYYIKRLINGLQNTKKTTNINDINLLRWKEYDNIITDSLWIIDKRDTSGAHLGWYWGNFIPQIPNQMILRYTKFGEWILDPFVGSGTTLIECKRLGRNGIGIELNQDVVIKAKDLLSKEKNTYSVVTEIISGDSRTINLKEILDRYEIKNFQLIILHPPYYDIIKFSKLKNDLSNAKNIKEFLKMFGEVLDNVIPFLEKNRYLILVIGDKYSKGEWIPLGFYCMEEVLKRNFLLKSIVVKNFEETRGKRNQKELWRYRALLGGFYVFKHEYIFIFKKRV